MNNKRLLDISDFSRDELMETIRLLGSIRDNTEMFKNDCGGKTLATVFVDADRNRELAFKAAVSRLSGFAFSFDYNPAETLKDNVLTACSASDVIVLRHPLKGAALAASLYATVPVINAGDGDASLPCDNLRDISTIWYAKNHVSNMTIGFCGDLSDGGLIGGLSKCLAVYNGNRFLFVSSTGGELSDELRELLEHSSKEYEVRSSLDDIIGECDVLYMTHIMRKDYSSDEAYNTALRKCRLDERIMPAAKNDLVILHPMPRGEELPQYVDGDARFKHFMQLDYSVYANMTVIFKLFKSRVGRTFKTEMIKSTHGFRCGHKDCITSTEDYLPGLFDERGDELVCRYCKNPVER